MDEEYYAIFSSNSEKKLLFIEKHQKDDTVLKVKTLDGWMEYGNKIGYEVVDISTWEYTSFDDKCLQVQNYQENVKKR